VTENRK